MSNRGLSKQQVEFMREAMTARPTPEPGQPRTVWLIERGQSMNHVPTVWWAGQTRWGLMTRDEWTTDANAAVHYASREDAEAYIEQRSPIPSNRDRWAVATEHGFVTDEEWAEAAASSLSPLGTRESPAPLDVDVLNKALLVIYARPYKYVDGHLTAVMRDDAAERLAAEYVRLSGQLSNAAREADEPNR